MKIVFLSDTHGQHASLDVPDADMVVHCGDISAVGTIEQVQDFLQWFGSLPHPHRIFIGGNHDFLLEREPELFRTMLRGGCVYLNDSGVEIEGIRIWGSPISPEFMDWAFNRARGPEIDAHWAAIPEDTDLLLTHGPPSGILDLTIRGERVGCADLLRHVERVRPRVHAFGHVHESRGVERRGETCFINASNLDEGYRLAYGPVMVEWIADVVSVFR